MIEAGAEKLRRLRAEDIPAAAQLSAQAGWNQTEEDWRTLLELSPEGCLGVEVDGNLAATTTLLCYGRRLAWIGMALGEHWEAIRVYARGFDLVIALGLAALFLLWLKSHLRSS